MRVFRLLDHWPLDHQVENERHRGSCSEATLDASAMVEAHRALRKKIFKAQICSRLSRLAQNCHHGTASDATQQPNGISSSFDPHQICTNNTDERGVSMRSSKLSQKSLGAHNDRHGEATDLATPAIWTCSTKNLRQSIAMLLVGPFGGIATM